MRRGDIVDLGIFLFGVPGVVLILNGYLFGSFLFLLSVFMIFARDMTNNILERIGL